MLGTLFENSNYGGSTFTLFGATGCTSTSYGFASLTGGWESRVSSAKGQNGCSLTLYTSDNYSGLLWSCATNLCDSLPADVNDRVRSVVAK